MGKYNASPLRLDEIFDGVGNKKSFSKFDLRTSFNQIRV